MSFLVLVIDDEPRGLSQGDGSFCQCIPQTVRFDSERDRYEHEPRTND
jgi:hypothetical protein